MLPPTRPAVPLAAPRQAAADAGDDLEEVLRLRADVVNQTGPLATQADNLAKYFRILTCGQAAGPGRQPAGLQLQTAGCLLRQRWVPGCGILRGPLGAGRAPSAGVRRLRRPAAACPPQPPLLHLPRPLRRRLMESRFPVSHASGHARVEFAWFDAFRPQAR